MGFREQLDWIRNEWDIVARAGEMSRDESLRWLRQWVPFGVLTIGYGTISLTLGPVTPGHAASAWAARQWSKSALEGLRITAHVEGTHNVPAAGGYMYASNHQSLLDVLVLGATLPGDFKWAAKRSLMHIPFLGWHLRLAGHVPVDRKGGKAAADAVIRAFEQALLADHPLLVFPEGTRSDDGVVKPFKSGGFLAAVRADRPVMPVALEGTNRLMSKHAPDTGDLGDGRVRHVDVRIGEAIYPPRGGDEETRVAALRDATRAAVLELHASIGGPPQRAPAEPPDLAEGDDERASVSGVRTVAQATSKAS